MFVLCYAYKTKNLKMSEFMYTHVHMIQLLDVMYVSIHITVFTMSTGDLQ